MRNRSILRGLFLLGAIAGLSSSRKTSRRRETGRDLAPDPVDEAGEDSFPASDPPGWTLGEDRKG